MELFTLISAKVVAAGMTGILLTAGIGAAVADNHDVEVPEDVPADVVEVPEEIVEVPEVPADVVEVPADVVEVPEVPEEVVEVPEEIVEVPEEVPADTIEVPADVVEVPEEVEDGDEADDAQRGPRKDNFGARVSADARGESDGVRGVDGQQISAEARAKRAAR